MKRIDKFDGRFNERMSRFLDLMVLISQKRRPFSINEVHRDFDWVSRRTVQRDINQLVQMGFVEISRRKKGYPGSLFKWNHPARFVLS